MNNHIYIILLSLAWLLCFSCCKAPVFDKYDDLAAFYCGSILETGILDPQAISVPLSLSIYDKSGRKVRFIPSNALSCALPGDYTIQIIQILHEAILLELFVIGKPGEGRACILRNKDGTLNEIANVVHISRYGIDLRKTQDT